MLIWLTLTTAFALRLPPLPAAPLARLPFAKEEAVYACADIPAKLAEYNEKARQHDQSLTAFFGQVGQKLNEWYELLSPYENEPAGKGTFQPLLEGAAQVSLVTDLGYDNAELLATEMDRILRSLELCSIQKK